MEQDRKTASGRPRKVACGHCFEGFPAEEMEEHQGTQICLRCYETIQRKTRKLARDEPAAGSSPGAPGPDLEIQASLGAAGPDPEIQASLGGPGGPDLDPEIRASLADEAGPPGLPSGSPGIRGTEPYDGPAPPPPGDRVEPPPPPARPFWEDIPGVITYPLRGRGLGMTLVGGVTVGIAMWIAARSIFGFLLSIPLSGYLIHFWFNVIRTSSRGLDDPPDWPEFFDVYNTMIHPLLVFIGCILVSLAPMLLLVALIAGPLPLNLITIGLLMILFLAGLFIWPMSVMAYALFNSFGEAASFRLLFDSIRKILPDYVLLFTALCILYALEVAVVGFASRMALIVLPEVIIGTVAVSILTYTLSIYFLMMQARLIGHVYLQASGRLGWFAPEVRTESTLSPPIVILGAASAVLVAGLGVGLLLWLPGATGRAVAPIDYPFEDGTYLEYHIFNSDEGARGARYDFADTGDGFLVSETAMVAGIEGLGRTIGVRRDGTLVMPGSAGGPVSMDIWGQATHGAFCGPTRYRARKPYLNTLIGVGEETWWGYPVIRADDEISGGSFYFERETGILVGANVSGIGFEHWVVLVETNFPGLVVPEDARSVR